MQNPPGNRLVHSLGRFRNQRLQTANIIIRARRGRFKFGHLDENLLHARRDFRLARLVVQTLLARLETREGGQSARHPSVIACFVERHGRMKYENETIRLVRKHKRTRARVPDGSSSGAIPREPRRAAVERPSKAPRRARARTRLEPSDTDPRTRRDANTTRRKQSNTTYQLRASLLVLRRVHDESRRFASAVDASACLGLQKHPSHEESRTVVSHHTQTSTPKLPPLFALDDASASATTTSTVDASSFDRSRSRRSAIQIFPHSFPSRVASRHPSTAAPADPSKVAPTSSSSRARERGCRARASCVVCRVVLRVARTYPRRADALGARKKT